MNLSLGILGLRDDQQKSAPEASGFFPFELVHTSMGILIFLLLWNAQISSLLLSLPTSLLAH